jgi:hypothetical protein
MFSHASATKPVTNIAAQRWIVELVGGANKLMKDLASSTPATVPLPPRPPGVTDVVSIGQWDYRLHEKSLLAVEPTTTPICFIMKPTEVRRLAHRGEKEGRVSY